MSTQQYVFRFSRGNREDLFNKEVRDYELIACETDIPTPQVHVVDRSKSIVPVSYMIMDCMQGEEAQFLSHPQNPTTGTHEKRETQKAVLDTIVYLRY